MNVGKTIVSLPLRACVHVRACVCVIARACVSACMGGGEGGRAYVKQTLTDSPPEQNRENEKAGGGERGGRWGGGEGGPLTLCRQRRQGRCMAISPCQQTDTFRTNPRRRSLPITVHPRSVYVTCPEVLGF